MAVKSMLDIAAPEGQFDLRTHYWDGQGNLVKKDLYIKYCIGTATNERDGQGRPIYDTAIFYERPVNSGNLWDESGKPAGRVEKKFSPSGSIIEKKFLVGDAAVPHKEYHPTLQGDEALMYKSEQQQDRIALLEAELAALKREQGDAPKSEYPAKTKYKVPSGEAT